MNDESAEILDDDSPSQLMTAICRQSCHVWKRFIESESRNKRDDN